MSEEINKVFYYTKEGKKINTTCDQLRIPEDIYHSVIDNLHETLEFVVQTSLLYDLREDDILKMASKSIVPYSEAVNKYGYEFFVSNIVKKHEIVDISCFLREM